MIEFNKHHYSDLWVRREHYKKALGVPSDPYDGYINMINSVFPGTRTVVEKQELIKIIMLAQADAVNNKLDVSSLKAPKVKRGLLNRIFKRKK